MFLRFFVITAILGLMQEVSSIHASETEIITGKTGKLGKVFFLVRNENTFISEVRFIYGERCFMSWNSNEVGGQIIHYKKDYIIKDVNADGIADLKKDRKTNDTYKLSHVCNEITLKEFLELVKRLKNKKNEGIEEGIEQTPQKTSKTLILKEMEGKVYGVLENENGCIANSYKLVSSFGISMAQDENEISVGMTYFNKPFSDWSWSMNAKETSLSYSNYNNERVITLDIDGDGYSDFKNDPLNNRFYKINFEAKKLDESSDGI